MAARLTGERRRPGSLDAAESSAPDGSVGHVTEQIPSTTESSSSARPAEGASASLPAATTLPGDPLLNRIRSASRELDDIGSVPLADAARRFENVHAELQAALSDLDDA